MRSRSEDLKARTGVIYMHRVISCSAKRYEGWIGTVEFASKTTSSAIMTFSHSIREFSLVGSLFMDIYLR